MQEVRPVQVPIKLAQALHVRAVIHKQKMSAALAEILAEALAPELKSIEAAERARQAQASKGEGYKGACHE